MTLVAKEATYVGLIYALCKRLGLGYRVEPYAVVIGSGNLIALPKPRVAKEVEDAAILMKAIRLEVDSPYWRANGRGGALGGSAPAAA
jgi:hypothetical protein